MTHWYPRDKMKEWLLILALAILNVIIGFACYNASRPTYSYLFGSIHSRWYNAKLAKITEEGYNMCPPETDGFCKTPCWNVAPYQEPKFVLMPNCTEYSSRQALVYVYSSLDNLQLRQSLRQEFQKALQQQDGSMTVSLVFVVGLPTNETLANTVIKNEHKTFGDIMQISIPDLYIYLGFKGLAVFKWVQQCGEKTKYLAKLDDNSIFSMKTVFQWLRFMMKKDLQKGIACTAPLYDYHVYEEKDKPHWENDFNQYYSTKFPAFCQGKGGTFFTRQVALSLYKAGRGLPVYHTDDAYITGMLRDRACIDILHWGPIDKIFLGLWLHTMHTLVEFLAYELVMKDMDRKERAKNVSKWKEEKFYI